MSTIMQIIRKTPRSIYRNPIPLLRSSKALLNSSRCFNCTSKLHLKMFMEHENKYAYNIMENKGYTISLSVDNETTSLTEEQFDEYMQKDWSKVKPKQLFECFPMFGVYCMNNNLCISNKIFDAFIDNLTDSIKFASDEELMSLFYSVCKWPETESIRTRNYIEVWAALDDECLARLRDWTYDKMLSFVALFFMLNVTKVSEFSQKSLQKMASKAKQLTTSQIVQTMFFIGVLRRTPFDMHNLEVELDKRFSEFTVDDLAIVSMGFFKSKTPIRSIELVSKIINQVMKNSKHIHEVSLASLLKVIRYSIRGQNDSKEIYELLDNLQYEVFRLSVMCNVHIALLGTTTLTLHEACLNKIADATNKSMSKTRLKDLERLVLTYGTFNIKPKSEDCFFQKVMDELRKPERYLEIDKYGRAYACTVAFLSLSGIYPVDLMNKVLSSDFLSKTYGKQCYLYGKEVLVVHNSAEIFHPGIKMNRLTDKCAIILSKKYTDFVPNENYSKQFNITESMFLSIKNLMTSTRGGDNYVVGDHILTHHQRGDIIICNNPNGSPLPILEIMEKQKFGLIRKLPDKNNWIVLVIAGRNSSIQNTNGSTGPFLTKIRELKALGYHAALVKWATYESLQTNEQKLLYINELIEHAVNNKLIQF